MLGDTKHTNPGALSTGPARQARHVSPSSPVVTPRPNTSEGTAWPRVKAVRVMLQGGQHVHLSGPGERSIVPAYLEIQINIATSLDKSGNQSAHS